MTVELIKRYLHDVDEIDVEEHRLIHKRICEVAGDHSCSLNALNAAIEACDTLIDWAEATKTVLTPLLEVLIDGTRSTCRCREDQGES